MINAVSFESITIIVLKNFSTEANSRIPTLLRTVPISYFQYYLPEAGGGYSN